MTFLLYFLATVALATGTAAIYMAMIETFPVKWLYYHYFIRKPIAWTIFLGSLIWVTIRSIQTDSFPTWSILPIFVMGLSIILTYKMHQENAFVAVDFPEMANNSTDLPIEDKMQVAIVEYKGVTKAYPLDYVIHHHIINDRFEDSIIALTYCAMCRSIIPFEVSDIGPLFVGSFKNANMIVADRKTKTFFQQATHASVIGKLHPHTLTMLPFHILSWKDVKKLDPMPLVAKVTEKDFREFQLPIPGVWKKIVASEATPGLSAQNRDKTLPARTHVVGITDKIARAQPVAYIKDELLQLGVVKNEELGIFLIASNNTVNGFKDILDENTLNLELNPDITISDKNSNTIWDLRGKYIQGKISSNLQSIALSDEYWFSWKLFHPTTKLIQRRKPNQIEIKR